MAKSVRRSTDLNGHIASLKARATEDKEQAKRFKKTAKELETDETGTMFEAAVRHLLPAKKTP